LKRTGWLILILVILLGATAGWWFFYGSKYKGQAEIRSALPTDAVLLFSSRDLGASWDSLQQRPLWQVVNRLPGMQRMQFILAQADEQGLLKQLRGKEVIFSLHPTERYKFDWLFAMPVANASDYGAFNEWRKNLESKSGKASIRKYRNAELYQFTFPDTKQPFTLFVKDGLLVGSFTAYLVEEAARRLDSPQEETDASLPANATSASGAMAGQLEVFWPNLPELFSLFVQEPEKIEELLPALPYKSNLDVLIGEDGTLFTGFTNRTDTAASPDFLWSLHQQEPQRMTLTRFVPQRAASLMFLGLSDAVSWHHQLQEYWGTLNKVQAAEWNNLTAQVPALDSLSAYIGSEIGLATLPAVGKAEPGRLLYIKLKDEHQGEAYLENLAEKLADANQKDTVYREIFRDYTIAQLHTENLPQKLLGGAFWGFPESYYLLRENYLVIGNSVQALRDVVLDEVAEETWQRSLTINRYLSRLDAEHNYGLYIQASQFWPVLTSALAPEWQKFWNEQPTLKQFDLISAQLSATQEGLYTNVFLHQELKTFQEFENVQLVSTGSLALDAPLVTLKEINEGKARYLIQDSQAHIYLVGKNKLVLAKDSLAGRWLGTINVIPAHSNRSAKYLFPTDSLIYLFKEDLSPVSPFPLALPGQKQLHHLTLIDYSGNGFYRLLAADTEGALYMFDMDGINLEGWRPLSTGSKLAAAPQHIRIRNKDVIYAFTQDGRAVVLNRRGQPYPRFPMNLGDSLLGPVLIKPGNDFSTTNFITVTANGWLVEFNLEGNLIQRKQLYRPDPRAKFFLVPDTKNQTYLIAQQERFNLRFLNPAGRELFEKDYLGSTDLQVQYIYTGGDSGYILVEDQTQEFAYLYNTSGVLLQNKPINSSALPIVKIPANRDSVEMVKIYGNNLQWLEFPK
jgi:hypothetical protein